MQAQHLEMPKTRKEQLDAIEAGGSILIDETKRQHWATTIARLYKDTCKQFTIRTDKETLEIRVWRLK